ncbi:TetR/AcrR family transcriptional regulator [Denitrobaculum tricleocarpae]|uniref:TetR/AcrR family transcriptional regulator n=1 Tax=Denitrobaculum tricleocarpae TaxID=2591009 RepID=A0A545U2T6_9PROT|nr:TetR/AcrR family transcriptional regulator [Denitrobaculum tricleocarpae]TQV83789.1 TetR/AcrR family transcriptional regulator [Denitrobaculum tricleocarpae]
MKNNPSIRGRPRSFDQERALDAAMELFWHAGFDAATYDVLEQATGQRRQSLVYAFGDKQALFHAALKRYAETRVEAVCKGLESSPVAKAGIRHVLDDWLKDARRKRRRGCLMVMTAGELGPRDPAAAQIIEAARRKLVAAFARALHTAREQGDLATGPDVMAVSEMLVAAGDGALLHARSGGAVKAAEHSLNAVFDLLFQRPR